MQDILFAYCSRSEVSDLERLLGKQSLSVKEARVFGELYCKDSPVLVPTSARSYVKGKLAFFDMLNESDWNNLDKKYGKTRIKQSIRAEIIGTKSLVRCYSYLADFNEPEVRSLLTNNNRICDGIAELE